MEKKKLNKKKYPYKLEIKVNSPAEEIELSKLIKSSADTGTPITIVGDRISDFKLKKDNKIIDNHGKIVGIKLFPGRLIPLNLRVLNTDVGFDNLQFRGIKKRNSLKLSTEERNLPFKFEFIFDTKNQKANVKFKITKKADVKQLFKWKKYIMALNENQGLSLIDPETNNVLFKHENNLNIDSGDQESYELFNKLAKVQDCLKHKIIPSNLNLTYKDIEKINEAWEIIRKGKIKINIENFKFKIKISEYKNLLKNLNGNNSIMMLDIGDDYIIKIFDEKLNFGPFRIHLDTFKIVNQESLKEKMKNMKDEEIVEIIIKPDKENLIQIFKNYPFC